MSKHRSGLNRPKTSGFTLIEVVIAVTIMAIIGVISYQSLDVSERSQRVLKENMKELARLDRVWLRLENDLHNIVNHSVRQQYGPGSGSILPPLQAESGGDYWLTIMRGGHSNPLNFVRTELIRVGYRLEDETLWRDVWYNLSSVDEEQSRGQKIIENVERIEVRLLKRNASSFSGGPWLDRWPEADVNAFEMPLALEVTLKLEDKAEIKRLFSIVEGA